MGKHSDHLVILQHGNKFYGDFTHRACRIDELDEKADYVSDANWDYADKVLSIENNKWGYQNLHSQRLSGDTGGAVVELARIPGSGLEEVLVGVANGNSECEVLANGVKVNSMTHLQDNKVTVYPTCGFSGGGNPYPHIGAYEYEVKWLPEKNINYSFNGLFSLGCWEAKFDFTNQFNDVGVTNMHNAFKGVSDSCTFKGLELFDTSIVEDFSTCFDGLRDLNVVKSIEKWDVSSATNMDGMLNQYSNWGSLDLSGWYVPKISTMPSSFSGLAPGRQPKWGQPHPNPPRNGISRFIFKDDNLYLAQNPEGVTGLISGAELKESMGELKVYGR